MVDRASIYSCFLIACCGFFVGCTTMFQGDDHGDGGSDATSAVCGNGVIEEGEECDDGNTEDNDGCDSACRVEVGWLCEGEPSICKYTCGDGIKQEWEECDGVDLGGQTCESLGMGFSGGDLSCTEDCRLNTFNCILPHCGDGVLDLGEECDHGENNSNEGECLVNCRRAVCGDGFVWEGVEECDDGPDNSDTQPGACRTDCTLARCGDGVVDPGEECDDGPDNSNTQPGACRTNCVLPYCGDGVVDPWEECEWGSTSCMTTCGTIGTTYCESCSWGYCYPPVEVCNGVDDDCDGMTDMLSCMNVVYRFYNPDTGDHMYKVNNTTPDPGYVSETFNRWYVYKTNVPGTMELFQRFNGTNHFLTGNPNEGDHLGYWTVTSIGYIGRNNVQPWEAAGMSYSKQCRYYNNQIGDHVSYIEVDPEDIPEGYVLEFCAHYWWGFQ